MIARWVWIGGGEGRGREGKGKDRKDKIHVSIKCFYCNIMVIRYVNCYSTTY